MSEAIIVRGGKAIDQSAALSSINNNINNLWDAINDINSKPSIPIYPDRCSILVTVLDSAGAVMENAAVHCLDGTSWYNYTTNSSGQVLFTTNSGMDMDSEYSNWGGGGADGDTIAMNGGTPYGGEGGGRHEYGGRGSNRGGGGGAGAGGGTWGQEGGDGGPCKLIFYFS